MRFLAALLLAAGLAAAVAVPPASAATDAAGLARTLATRLHAARHAPTARIHSTDFAGTNIGCIVLPRWEMRRYGYRGHALACEEASAGEVLGAVLDRSGRMRCRIAGSYRGDDCYDITICDVAETLCVR